MTGRTRSTEAGFSLIEVLVTVSIVGITFAVFVGGMGTSFLASDHHRKQAVAHASIRNFAEAIKAAPFSTNCATVAASYAKAYSPPPPERRTSAGSAASTVSHVAPSVTPLSPNTRLLAFFALAGGTSLTPPAGMTPGWAFSSNATTVSSRVTIGFADQAVVAHAPTGTRTATSAAAADSVGQLVSLQKGASALVRRDGVLTAATPAAGGTSLRLQSSPTTAVGDAMFAQVALRGSNATIGPPPGWTLVNARAHASSVKSFIFERTATAAGTTQFDWTFSAATEAAGGVVSYGGTSKSYIATITADSDPLTPDGVEFWDGTDFSATCPASPENNNIQRVWLRLESTDQRAVQTIQVVKRCHEKPTPFGVCEDSP